MRLTRPGRNQAGVVECVDDLRPLARLVVDLLVRARGEKAGEGVHHREQTLAGEPCGHRHQVLLGDPDLDEARRLLELDCANATVRGEIGVQHDHLRPVADQA